MFVIYSSDLIWISSSPVDCALHTCFDLVLMARKGRVDHKQTKQKQKTSLSEKEQWNASETESVLKQNPQDDKQTTSIPVCETSERDMDHAVDTDLAGDSRPPGSVTEEESRYIPYGHEHINCLMRSLLDILSTSSPSENIALTYNAAIRKLRIPLNQWMERNRPLIAFLNSRVYKARDLVTKKIRQASPVVSTWLIA
ncbi:hypothetical protein Bca52824_055207 [Brassica carinata]|uniref:Uncharacterized protein n=1 Tax=Brassica carinata TaxID=52824 RepID=A0A8X7R9F8_BRACI|nr:hypothetical protein Bca52824_055207 [Brassica carinata]